MAWIQEYSSKYIFWIGLIIAFFLDGSLSYNLSFFLFRSFIAVPYVSLLWLVLFALFANRFEPHLMAGAIVLGIAYDWYYTGIFGVYIFIFPVVLYLTKILYHYLSLNFVSNLIIYGVDLIVVEMLSWITSCYASKVAQIVPVSGGNYLLHAFIPTLFINLFLFIIFYKCIKKIIDACQHVLERRIN